VGLLLIALLIFRPVERDGRAGLAAFAYGQCAPPWRPGASHHCRQTGDGSDRPAAGKPDGGHPVEGKKVFGVVRRFFAAANPSRCGPSAGSGLGGNGSARCGGGREFIPEAGSRRADRHRLRHDSGTKIERRNTDPNARVRPRPCDPSSRSSVRGWLDGPACRSEASFAQAGKTTPPRPGPATRPWGLARHPFIQLPTGAEANGRLDPRRAGRAWRTSSAVRSVFSSSRRPSSAPRFLGGQECRPLASSGQNNRARRPPANGASLGTTRSRSVGRGSEKAWQSRARGQILRADAAQALALNTALLGRVWH